MKTITIIMVALMAFTSAFTARADNDKPVSVEQLPAKSREFIQEHFQNNTVSYAKMENDFLEKSYEVFFVNGSKVEFDKNGDWKDVDCGKEQVPAGIVPDQIGSYVKKNHPGQQIVKIDRDRRDYEIELKSGLEIKFDLKYRVIEYDD